MRILSISTGGNRYRPIAMDVPMVVPTLAGRSSDDPSAEHPQKTDARRSNQSTDVVSAREKDEKMTDATTAGASQNDAPAHNINHQDRGHGKS